VGIEMVTCRVQTRLERTRTGPDEWLVVTRWPLAGGATVEGQTSPEAGDQDAHYGYRYYLTHALKPAFNAARGKRVWTRIRCGPGRAGITT
jgi:hypothetical protein